MGYGLYEVIPNRICQVRGFDLANITFIRGNTGWIVFDPLTAAETARGAEAEQRQAGRQTSHLSSSTRGEQAPIPAELW